MAKESEFVETAQQIAHRVLTGRLEIERGAALLYEITVDNTLSVTVNPKKPSRGSSAFQTDLCIFERRGDVRLPRVVMEFKTRVTTHDVLTYSAKARKHKQVYPYLRYGLVASEETTVPGRVFTHNESLDFCMSLGALPRRQLGMVMGALIKAEVRASRKLENIIFGKERVWLFRREVLKR
jgi:hypothetical protein